MKLILILLTILLVFSACQSSENTDNNKRKTLAKTENTDCSVKDEYIKSNHCFDEDLAKSSNTPQKEIVVNYEIERIEEVSDDGMKAIRYPKLNSIEDDFSEINSLIYSELENWLNNEFSTIVMTDIDYEVTLFDDKHICILFEGMIDVERSAYPVNDAKTVYVSLADKKIIDISCPSNLTEMLKLSLQNETTDLESKKEPFKSALTYVSNRSDEELQTMITNGEIALTDDKSYIVCLDVPHAIGDYVKIRVTNTVI